MAKKRMTNETAASVKVEAANVNNNINRVVTTIVGTIKSVEERKTKSDSSYVKLEVDTIMGTTIVNVGEKVFNDFEKKSIKFKDLLTTGVQELVVEVHKKGQTSYVQSGVVKTHDRDSMWLVGINVVGTNSLHNANVHLIAKQAGLSGLDLAKFLIENLKS